MFKFKVVKTIEEGSIVFTEIPENWEHNNVLFWPVISQRDKNAEKKLLKLKCTGVSPDSGWEQISCEVKGVYPSFQLAKEAAVAFTKMDTEEETRHDQMSTKKSKYRRATAKSNKRANKDFFFNNNVSEIQQPIMTGIGILKPEAEKENSSMQLPTTSPEAEKENSSMQLPTTSPEAEKENSSMQLPTTSLQIDDEGMFYIKHHDNDGISSDENNDNEQLANGEPSSGKSNVLENTMSADIVKSLNSTPGHFHVKNYDNDEIYGNANIDNNVFDNNVFNNNVFDNGEPPAKKSKNELENTDGNIVQILNIPGLDVVSKQLENLTASVENQGEMFSKCLAEVNVRLDYLCKIVDAKSSQDTTPLSKLDLADLKCPLSTAEDIEEFENGLKDPVLFKELVQKLSEVGGRDGRFDKVEAAKTGLKISFMLFTKQILMEYNWTGKTKTPKGQDQVEQKKKNFLKFEKIKQLFFEVLKLCSDEFTITLTEHFLKNNLLKHAKLRVDRETKGEENETEN